MNPKDGEIIITLPESGFSDKHLASTRIYTHKETGHIVKAKIQMLPKNAKKERVLEHEIGHALGWYHYPQRYHMMHPNWRLGGYERRGLQKR
jgi:predicted Zn-dependent protease